MSLQTDYRPHLSGTLLPRCARCLDFLPAQMAYVRRTFVEGDNYLTSYRALQLVCARCHVAAFPDKRYPSATTSRCGGCAGAVTVGVTISG